MVFPGSPPHQKFPTERDSPTLHTPRKKRPQIIKSDKGAEASPSHVGKTGLETGSEEPITKAPQRLPDSLFPTKLSPKPYQRPGTPYRRVDLPSREAEPDTKETETGILDRTDDSFEIDSESERTLKEEPKETPKCMIAKTPQGIRKRKLKLAPVIIPFGPNPEKPPKSPEKPLVQSKLPVKPAPTAPVPPVIVPVVRSPSVSPVRTPSASPPTPISPLIGPLAMGMVEEIKNALIESNRVAAMPIPQFYGKKGEKPEDHIMKVENYFQNYNITDQEQKCNRFRDTCCGKARMWLSTLTEYPKVFDSEAAPDEATKAKTMKSLFLARWQLKGRTPQTLYMEWQNLKFDPGNDDIKDFYNDVKNLANRLGYPEDAQVMAINATLPPVLVTQVINVKTFKEIRDTLITLVENPVIKRVLLTRGTGKKGLIPFSLSQMQWQPENDVGMGDSYVRNMHGEGVWWTPKTIGKIINKLIT